MDGHQYSDLASCNAFAPSSAVGFFLLPLRQRKQRSPAASAYTAVLPATPAQVVWQGRGLNDSTHQALPQARLLPAAATTPVPVDAAGAFNWRAQPARPYPYRVQTLDYLAVTGTWQTTAADRREDILLKKLRVGTTFNLLDLRFKRGKGRSGPRRSRGRRAGRAATRGRFQGLGGHHRRQLRGVVEGHKR